MIAAGERNFQRRPLQRKYNAQVALYYVYGVDVQSESLVDKHVMGDVLKMANVGK